MAAYRSNLSITQRLSLGFALILLLSLISMLVGISKLNTSADSTQQMLNNPIQTERLISDWYRDVFMAVRRTAAIARSSDPSLATYFSQDTAESTARTSKVVPTITERMTTDEEKALLAKIGEVRKNYLIARDAITALKKEDKVDEAI